MDDQYIFDNTIQEIGNGDKNAGNLILPIPICYFNNTFTASSIC